MLSERPDVDHLGLDRDVVFSVLPAARPSTWSPVVEVAASARGDSDSDGACDDTDTCPDDANDDSDGDGSCASDALCTGNDNTGDTDEDDAGDVCDTCPDDLDPLDYKHIHLHTICRAKMAGPDRERIGVGIVETVVFGRHTRSGFRELLDGAP